MNILGELIYWREPLWILLVLFPVIVMYWQWLQQRLSLRLYADVTLYPWVLIPNFQKNKNGQMFAQILIWFLFGLAAAGPRLLLSVPKDLLPPQGAVVIAVDHSRSMQARDVFPNRLQQSHETLRQWAQEKDDIKKGLIIFAGVSHIVLPATSDEQVFQEVVFLLNKIQLPTHGSDIVSAISQAELLLSKEAGARAIILLTDGDMTQETFKQLQQIIKPLQQKNIDLHLLGIGTPSSVALTDNLGRWLEYEGELVLTQLKEKDLQALAENENVFYHLLDPSVHNSLSNIWQPETPRIAAQHYDDVIWQELFAWFLIPALVLIVLNQITLPVYLSTAANFSIFIVIILIVLLPQSVRADTKGELHRAFNSWQIKDYSRAAKIYENIEGYLARMGEGASCFRDKQIECAIKAFSRAAWQAKNDEQRGRAVFNLGNSFFKQGDFKSAISLYQDALRYQPQQQTYQNNLKFSEEVQRNIELRLKQEAESQIDAKRGSGWKAVDINNDQISNMNIVLDDKMDEQQSSPWLINLTEDQLALYMLQSKRFAQLSHGQNKAGQRQHDWHRFSNENPVAAQKVKYWQRLFELEEGVPAHPDEPKILQGVRPW